MITSTHTIENLSKKIKCNECKNQNPPPIWRRVTQWKTCVRKFFKLEGKKKVVNLTALLCSLGRRIEHTLWRQQFRPQKNKIDVYCHEEEIIPIVAKRRWTSCFWKRDRWTSVRIKSFWRERKRRLPTVAAAAAIYWQREESVELGARILVRCATQESLYCDGEFLFSAKCTRETRASLENAGLARDLTSN
jgi:hypothetical protein